MTVICVCGMPCEKEKGLSVMHVHNVCLNVNDVLTFHKIWYSYN